MSDTPRRDWQMLALAALLPLAATVALYALEIPLGKPGTFVYLYSPIAARRLGALPSGVLLAAILACATWLVGVGGGRRRRGGLLLVALGCLTVGGWSFVAPPDYRSQHYFNMLSPSHDGAFLSESKKISAVRTYLRAFPRRALTPPEEMKGTRVVSNPPGTTLLAYGVRRLLDASPPLRRLLDWTLRGEGSLSAEQRVAALPQFGFAWALTGLWILSAPFLYLYARLFLPDASAAALCVLCLVSPTTFLFTPGKDPAQLLTVAVPLWLWLWAYRRRRSWPAAAAGGLFVLACMVSLVHVWIAAALWLACALHARTEAARRRAFWRRNVLPAFAGAAAVALLADLLLDWNVLASAWAAARAQARVTRGPAAMPLIWQTLGVPLFLLFAGPGLWSAGLWLARGRLRDDDARLGAALLWGSALIMLVTVGFTNLETPRLWIPFTPLLLLGAALQLPAFRAAGARQTVLLTVLVFVQVGVAAAQWTLMDVREAETRLLEGAARFFG